MSKSMLVIDTPCSCVTCPLSFYSGLYKEYQCRGREYYRTIDNYEWQTKQMCRDDIRPEWCPLSPFPPKKEKNNENRYDYFELRSIVENNLGFDTRGCEEELLKLGFDIPYVNHYGRWRYEYCDYWHYQLDAVFRKSVRNDSYNSIYVGTKDGIDYKKLKKQPNDWQRFILEKWNELLHPLANKHGWIKVSISW